MASWWIVSTPAGPRQVYSTTRPDATAVEIADPMPGIRFLSSTAPPALDPYGDEEQTVPGAGSSFMHPFQMPTDPAAAPSPPPVGGGSVLPPGYTPPANFTPEQVDEILRGLGAEKLAPGGPGAITRSGSPPGGGINKALETGGLLGGASGSGFGFADEDAALGGFGSGSPPGGIMGQLSGGGPRRPTANAL